MQFIDLLYTVHAYCILCMVEYTNCAQCSIYWTYFIFVGILKSNHIINLQLFAYIVLFFTLSVWIDDEIFCRCCCCCKWCIHSLARYSACKVNENDECLVNDSFKCFFNIFCFFVFVFFFRQSVVVVQTIYFTFEFISYNVWISSCFIYFVAFIWIWNGFSNSIYFKYCLSFVVEKGFPTNPLTNLWIFNTVN